MREVQFFNNLSLPFLRYLTGDFVIKCQICHEIYLCDKNENLVLKTLENRVDLEKQTLVGNSMKTTTQSSHIVRYQFYDCRA